jgi:hypothetical protein
MWAIIQIIAHIVMNTTAHSGSYMAYSVQCYVHTIKQTVIQLIAHSGMNTTAQGGSNTSYSAQCYERNSTQWQ